MFDALMCFICALGGGVAVWGWWGRPAITGRWCRGCTQAIDDLPHARCPECGRDLTVRGAVRTGRRVRRRRTMFASVVLMVAAGASVGGRRVWITPSLQPTWLLIVEAEGDLLPTRMSTWTELQRRAQAGTLSTREIERLVPLAFGHFALAPYARFGHPFLEVLLVDGRLSDDATQRYLALRVQLHLRVDRLVPGRTAAYEFGQLYPLSDTLEPCRFTVRSVAVDGRVVRHMEQRKRMSDTAGLFWVPEAFTESGEVVFEVVLDSVGRGEHKREFTTTEPSCISARVLENPYGRFDVYEELNDPTWSMAMPDIFRASATLRRDTRDGTLRARPVAIDSIAGMPDFAFDVYWNVDGNLWWIESFAYAPRRSDYRRYAVADLSHLPETVRHVDVVLRTSLKAADLHPGMRRVWIGEHTFRDVPVRRPRSDRIARGDRLRASPTDPLPAR